MPVQRKTRKRALKVSEKGSCRCDPSCKRPLVNNQPFCAVHMKKCSALSPLSGYEPVLDMDKYNNNLKIKKTHNCFAYALNLMDLPTPDICPTNDCDDTVPYHQPGIKSGYPKWKNIEGKRCPDLLARLRGDIPGLRMTTFAERCPKGTSKIATVIDSKHDYHFYRQDSNGMWSHKPGSSEVSTVDVSNYPIYNPELADRDNRTLGSNINYGDFCAYMCVPRTGKIRFKRGGKQQTRRRA